MAGGRRHLAGRRRDAPARLNRVDADGFGGSRRLPDGNRNADGLSACRGRGGAGVEHRAQCVRGVREDCPLQFGGGPRRDGPRHHVRLRSARRVRGRENAQPLRLPHPCPYPGTARTLTMKKLLIVSLLVVPSLFAADTHRYMVATTHAARTMKFHVLSAGEVSARNVRTFDAINGFAVDLTDAEAEEMRKSAGVRYVSRTIAVHAVGSVSPLHGAPRAEASPLATKQIVPPNIDLLHAREVWPVTRGGNVNIAIIDTGVDFAHADLAANIAGGYNTFTKN